MSEPTIRYVNGKAVPLTEEEIRAIKAEWSKSDAVLAQMAREKEENKKRLDEVMTQLSLTSDDLELIRKGA